MDNNNGKKAKYKTPDRQTINMSPKLMYDNDSMPMIPKLAFVKSPSFGQMGAINSVQRLKGEVYINEDSNNTIEDIDPSLDQKLAYDMMQRRRSL